MTRAIVEVTRPTAPPTTKNASVRHAIGKLIARIDKVRSADRGRPRLRSVHNRY